MEKIKIAGVIFIIVVIQSLLLVSIARKVAPNWTYSEPQSDLGVIPQSAPYWTTSVLLVGVLTIIGALLLFDFGKTHRLVLGSYVVYGIARVITAIFNENTFFTIHSYASSISFLFSSIFMIASFKVIKKPVNYLGLILGTISFLGLGFLTFQTPNIPTGLAEEITVTATSIWLFVLGIFLLVKGKHSLSN